MKSILCLFCIFVTQWSVAGFFVPSLTAVGADADTEVVVQGPVESASSLMIDFTVTNPTSSNTVLLAFGKDLDADGELSTEEIKYQVGWDAGEWVEYCANAVVSAPLVAGVSGNRLLMFKAPGNWDTANLIVRGSVSGKVYAGNAPTLILLR